MAQKGWLLATAIFDALRA